MATSYAVYDVSAFPSIGHEGIINAPEQRMVLPIRAEPPKTELAYKISIDHLDIDVFRALHEYIVETQGRISNIDAGGEVRNIEFEQYIAIRHFAVYHARGPRVLMLKTDKDTAASAVKQLSKRGDLKVNRRHIDLHSVKQYIHRFTGAWFQVVDSADVTSQALFGPRVDQDPKFVRAASEGQMNFMRFDYLFQDEVMKVGLSSVSHVVVYNDNLYEQLELELVLDLKKRLIDIATDAGPHGNRR